MKRILLTIVVLTMVLGCAKKVPVLHEEQYIVEYGTEFNIEQIKQVYKEYNVDIDDLSVDTMQVGEKEYTFKVDKTEMILKIVVDDTKMPIMEGETTYSVVEGSNIDYKKMTASDEVDGNLEVVYEGELDFNKVGEQKVIAKATDKNGNEVTKDIYITVTEKQKVEASKPNPTTPSNNNSNGSTGNNNNSSNTNPSNPTPPTSNGGGSALTPEQDKPVMTGQVKHFIDYDGKWRVNVQWESQRIGKFSVSVFENGSYEHGLAQKVTIDAHPYIIEKSIEVAMPYYNQ